MKSMIRKFVFSLMVMMLVCASFMLVAFVAPAAADVEVYFRVMPPVNESEYAKTGELYTLWAGNVTIPKEVNITCTSGWQYHLYINDADHYIQDKINASTGEVVASKDRGTGKWNKTVGATSVLAALHNASELGNFTYVVLDTWWIDMGFFVAAIGGPEMDWTYRIYNPEYALMPSVGSDSCLLGYNTTDTLTTLSPPQTQILWERGGYPLKVTTNKEEVDVGEEFTATVWYYPGDLGELVEWEPLGVAKLNVTGETIETFTSDDNGNVTIFMESNGTFELLASKRQYGCTYYVPSDNRTKVNVSGGIGATWWTQTTKDNFSAGTCNQVNVSVSPGDVLLECGGPVTKDYVLDGGTATLGGEHFYNNFTLINGATLNVPLGEILRVHANYIEVDSTSSINADGKGWSGGAGGAGDGNDGKGNLGGCGCFGVHSSTYGGGGGGAGHGGDGEYGIYSQCDANAEGGYEGNAYGKGNLKGDDTFYMGSGGGGGAGNGTDAGGAGGYGGGVVVLEGMSLENEPTIVINGQITAEGGSGTNGEGCGCGGGGGGSGGTILIKGKNISIANGALSARGGDGGNGATGGCVPACGGGGGGGGAGGGCIKVFFESMPYSSGHNVAGGFGGAGEYGCPSCAGCPGPGKNTDAWYNYTAKGETYSPILPFWSSGNFTSAAHDTNYSADFGKIYWCAAEPSNTSVKLQIATNNTWDFKGPDGTSSTYYETSGTEIWAGHDGDCHIKYKAFLSTTDEGKTPTVSKVGITYKEESAFPEVPAITPLGFLLALLSLFGLGAIAMRKMFK